MSDPLYGKALLRLAADAVGSGHLPHPHAKGSAHNPTCGDRVLVELTLDESGHITGIAHETKACVLTQASASILGAHLAGSDAKHVRRLRDQVSAMLQGGATPPSPFVDYDALRGAAEFRNRHICVLLPIDAVLSALSSPVHGGGAERGGAE